MFGVPEFEPNFFTDADTLLKVHGATLLNWVNQAIEEYWIIWDLKGNVWYQDGPVIFRIGNRNYEFVSQKLDEFSFTVDTIDLSKKLDWYGMGDELPLVWKKNSLEEINCYIGEPILEVNLLTYNSAGTALKFIAHRTYIEIEKPSETSNMLHGIEFVFPDKDLFNKASYLNIFNGIDQIRMTTEYIDLEGSIKKIKTTRTDK